ncbi:zinc ribbon domain-containing protein [Marispirochaeta aestuarii]|uniref:zinc ribbon domain-containing protein n=1 Tax=Marispirochaeta aestuarii TaxID=1963862 RepID=UPI0029C8523C|nr:zinc ribbon domain-containing protein [Marispirochaeta aestuarii]
MKTARFYCENCGRAVPFDARMCPHCGKNFDAVKCPVCNYTGMPGEFLQGCPECGYLTPEQKEERDAALSRGGRIKGAADPIPARRDRGRNREIGLKMERKERDEVLFSETKAPKKRIIHSLVYFLILVLLFGTLVSMLVVLFL